MDRPHSSLREMEKQQKMNVYCTNEKECTDLVGSQDVWTRGSIGQRLLSEFQESLFRSHLGIWMARVLVRLWERIRLDRWSGRIGRDLVLVRALEEGHDGGSADAKVDSCGLVPKRLSCLRSRWL